MDNSLLDVKKEIINCKETSLDSLCGICLSVSYDPIHFQNKDNKSKEILDSLFECFQITLLKDKQLPSVICKACFKEISIANNLRLKCLSFVERFSVKSEEFIKKRLKEEIIVDNENKSPLNDTYHSPDVKKEIFEDKNIVYLNDTSSHDPELKEEITDDENIIYFIDPSLHDQDAPKSPEVKRTKLECKICNVFFKTNFSYQQHLQNHNAPDIGKITGLGSNRRYHCAECTFNTNNRQTLKKHFRRHTGERPYKCECGKSFAQYSNLSAHKKSHTSLKNYTCTECGKQFKYSSAFRTHSRVHKTAQFQCSICNKNFKHPHGLREHMYRHNKIRNYSCEECGKAFVASSDFAHHKRLQHNKLLHNKKEIKEVECHLCGYKTYTKKDLISHFKEHADYKAYKCNTCKETFNTTNELRRHKRVHYKDKPFSCPLCVHKFTYSSRLNKHMLTFHNANDKGVDFKKKSSRQQNKVIEIKQ